MAHGTDLLTTVISGQEKRGCNAQEICAISGLGLTAATRGRGRMSEKMTRKMPYAAKTPKTRAATDAQINIARFNKSDIQSTLVNLLSSISPRRLHAKQAWTSRYNEAIVSELTLFSIDY